MSTEEITQLTVPDQADLATEQSALESCSAIEIKWNIPDWMMRHPGPRIEVPDDDVAFEEGA